MLLHRAISLHAREAAFIKGARHWKETLSFLQDQQKTASDLVNTTYILSNNYCVQYIKRRAKALIKCKLISSFRLIHVLWTLVFITGKCISGQLDGNCSKHQRRYFTHPSSTSIYSCPGWGEGWRLSQLSLGKRRGYNPGHKYMLWASSKNWKLAFQILLTAVSLLQYVTICFEIQHLYTWGL